MMCKFLLALGLCFSLGQLGVGAVGLEEVEQYLARYQYLEEINVDDLMDRARAAADAHREAYTSREEITFHVFKFNYVLKNRANKWSSTRLRAVMKAFSQLKNCVTSRELSTECIEIVEQDLCNIKLRDPINKAMFHNQVARAREAPDFNIVQGLFQDVGYLLEMVEELDLESEINTVESFKSYVTSAHELMLFTLEIDFAEMRVSRKENFNRHDR